MVGVVVAVLVWLLGRRDVRAGVVAASKRATGQAVEIKIATSASMKPGGVATQTTTGAATTARPARSANEQWYPDHAVINLTADQLKAMPRFEYN